MICENVKQALHVSWAKPNKLFQADHRHQRSKNSSHKSQEILHSQDCILNQRLSSIKYISSASVGCLVKNQTKYLTAETLFNSQQESPFQVWDFEMIAEELWHVYWLISLLLELLRAIHHWWPNLSRVVSRTALTNTSAKNSSYIPSNHLRFLEMKVKNWRSLPTRRMASQDEISQARTSRSFS